MCGLGPSVPPLPRAGTPPVPPAGTAPLRPSDPGPFCFPAITFLPAPNHGPIARPYTTTALCCPTEPSSFPRSNPGSLCTAPEPLPSSPPQPRPLCHPPNPHPLYTQIHQKTHHNLCPSDHNFPSFLLRFCPLPSSPLPGYCGYFRLAQVGAPCRGQPWSRRLQRDRRVCVQCWGNLPHRRPHCTGHGLQGAR